MIHGEDHRRRLRNVLHAGELDAAEENLRHEPDDRGDAAPHHACRPRHAANVQIAPPITIATGTMRNACSREVASEIFPISGGDGMSPSKCMTKTERPKAVARSAGATAFTIAEFTGPVDMKMSSSAITIAVRYTACRESDNATYVTGAAISVAMPETHRYDCFVQRRKKSPNHPPANVPTNPVTSAIRPNVTVAWLRVMPRDRSRNAGIQNASPPNANVYAP